MGVYDKIDMVYHTCPDCGEENYFEDPFVSKMKDKIISLQAQLLRSYEGKVTVDAQDKLRFSAMIEVLESMLQ